jgi:hypothetical protein
VREGLARFELAEEELGGLPGGADLIQAAEFASLPVHHSVIGWAIRDA